MNEENWWSGGCIVHYGVQEGLGWGVTYWRDGGRRMFCFSIFLLGDSGEHASHTAIKTRAWEVGEREGGVLERDSRGLGMGAEGRGLNSPCPMAVDAFFFYKRSAVEEDSYPLSCL